MARSCDNIVFDLVTVNSSRTAGRPVSHIGVAAQYVKIYHGYIDENKDLGKKVINHNS